MNDMEIIERIKMAGSLLGYRILSGDVNALSSLYGSIWQENPPLIKIVSQLQESITADEIRKDTTGKYSPEYLYYWGMTCLGEQSHLIFKDIGTAESCFRKICDIVPNADARLAYIGLLKSDEPAKSEKNVRRIDTLRRWAGKQDLFSSIVLARIVFYQFLNEYETNNSESSNMVFDENEVQNSELPLKVVQLLRLPCQYGHPVAVRFWNEVLDCIGTPAALNQKIDTGYVNGNILYDYKSMQICK